MSSRRLTIATLLGLLAVNLFVGGIGAMILFKKVTESKYRVQVANNKEYADRFALALGAQIRAGYSESEILAFLQEALEASPDQENRYLCVVHDNGHLLCHPDSGLRGADVSESLFFLPLPREGHPQSYKEWLADGIDHALLLDQQGAPAQLVNRAAVTGAPWNVLVHSDLSVLNREIATINNTILAVLIPLGVLFVLAGTLVVRTIGRRYEVAIEEANRDLEGRVAKRTSELEQTVRELQHTRDALVLNEKLAIMGQLMAGIAHEIRNPLGTISLFAGTLEEDAGDKAGREAARKILRAAERCELIITNMLSFARNDSARPVAISAGDVIEAALALMGAELRHAGVRLEKKIEAGDKVLFVDRIQIEQVILNLLSNALRELKDTGEGGTIRLHCLAAKDSVRIIIEDSGRGIPASIESHLFEPFQTTRPEGTGLGLSLCRRFVERHEGEIEYDRSPSLGGARFTITLPERKPENLSAAVIGEP